MPNYEMHKTSNPSERTATKCDLTRMLKTEKKEGKEKIRLTDNYSDPSKLGFRGGLAGGMDVDSMEALHYTFEKFSWEGWNEEQKGYAQRFYQNMKLQHESFYKTFDNDRFVAYSHKYNELLKHVSAAHPKERAYLEVALDHNNNNKWENPEKAAQGLIKRYKEEQPFKPLASQTWQNRLYDAQWCRGKLSDQGLTPENGPAIVESFKQAAAHERASSSWWQTADAKAWRRDDGSSSSGSR